MMSLDKPYIQDDQPKQNIRSYLLDPLTTIIKLAILGCKPVGTKIHIDENVIYFQEPGPFQSFCRYLYNTNKTDLQYLYNPIELACQEYLSKESVKSIPRMKNLFVCALKGIERLSETYRNSSIIRLCLNYYSVIMTNYIDQTYNASIFKKDTMSGLYTKEILKQLFDIWNHEKIKIVLNLIDFLEKDSMAENNVKSLENIINNIDTQIKTIFMHL